LVAGDQGPQGRERATDGENYVELRGRVPMTPADVARRPEQTLALITTFLDDR
jgi:hypothetical protein